MDFKLKTDEQLITLYKEAKDKYYSDESIMTDSDFDLLELEMESRDIELYVGSEESSEYGEVISHLSPMLSLAKQQINSETLLPEQHNNIIKLLKRSVIWDKTEKFVIAYKADGLAINSIYHDGQLAYSVTRGDGKQGRNVLDKIKHLLPNTVLPSIKEVRYECVIPTNIFVKKYSEEYSNPRNLASGILGNEDITDDRINDLRLINLYSVSTDNMHLANENTCYDVISKNELIDFDFMSNLYLRLVENRPKQDYPTDGFVIHPFDIDVNVLDNNGHDPNYSVSVKFPAKGSETIVTSIYYALGRSGEYIPNIRFEPFEIDGRWITKANGYNQGFIETNGIGIGSKITVNISGDIIPKIVSILTTSDNKVPLPQNSIIDGCHLYAIDAEDHIKMSKFIYGCYVLGFKHFGYASFKKLAETLDYNPFNIFDKTLINEQSLLSLGFGPTQSIKFVNTITKTASNKIDLNKIIVAMSISDCGWNTSTQVSKWIAKNVLNIDGTIFDIEPITKGLTHKVFESCTTGNDFDDIILNIEILKSNGVEVNFAKELPKASKFDESEIIKYVMTGSPKAFGFATKAEFVKTLPENWIEISKVKDANYLITDSMESKTSKTVEANKFNVSIKTYGTILS